MATPVIMPRQGQSVESCIITKWFKNKGETVKKGEVLFSYETDKASFEEEAPTDGILLDTFFREDDDVPVLENVGVIGEEGEDVSSFKVKGQKEAPAENQNPEKETATQVDHSSEDENSKKETGKNHFHTSISSDISSGTADEKIKISPRAKNKALKLNVPYESIKGTGPHGRIIERDITNAKKHGMTATRPAQMAASETRLEIPKSGTGLKQEIRSSDFKDAPTGGEFEEVKTSNIRKIIAKNMINSLNATAQLTLHISADARNMQALRKKYKKQMADGYPYNITYNDMICYAAVKTLKKYKDLNAHFLGETIRYFRNVHLGIAVDTPRGLMVPTIFNSDQLNIEGLSDQIKSKAEKCRSGQINPADLAGASFTITNLGSYGIEMFTPVLNPPQTGILGVNTITYRPAESEGVIAMVPHIGLSLTFDHQALDGAPAAAFLKDLKEEIENINT